LSDHIKHIWDRIDVLINNAGITEEKLLIKMEEEDFLRVLGVNLKGAFFITKELLPLMIKHGGHIIYISSISALKGQIGLASYSASKAGLIGVMRSLSRELAPYNIRVNAILPGYMMTDMGCGASEIAKHRALEESLLRRYTDPEEVADFIEYLINTKGVTGQVFNIDSRII
ncbi:MAG: SDR family oxidoreductase, partial [Nitrospirae bacterium]